MKLNLFRKTTLSIDKVIEEVIKNYNLPEIYCLVLFHRADKKVIPMCKRLKDGVIEIKGIYYLTDSKRIYEINISEGKRNYNIPVVSIYEGVTVSFTPYENIDTREFSEVFQDMISLNIERGILENKRKKQLNMRKMIAIGLIAFAGLFIAYKMLAS